MRKQSRTINTLFVLTDNIPYIVAVSLGLPLLLLGLIGGLLLLPGVGLSAFAAGILTNAILALFIGLGIALLAMIPAGLVGSGLKWVYNQVLNAIFEHVNATGYLQTSLKSLGQGLATFAVYGTATLIIGGMITAAIVLTATGVIAPVVMPIVGIVFAAIGAALVVPFASLFLASALSSSFKVCVAGLLSLAFGLVEVVSGAFNGLSKLSSNFSNSSGQKAYKAQPMVPVDQQEETPIVINGPNAAGADPSPDADASLGADASLVYPSPISQPTTRSPMNGEDAQQSRQQKPDDEIEQSSSLVAGSQP